MRTLKLLFAAALAVAAPQLAAATDSPHDESFTTGGCMACHRLHNSLGQSLTQQATISVACRNCHDAAGSPSHPLGFGVTWGTAEQANIAAKTGTHHRWDAAAVNATAGATTPDDAEMQKRLVGGALECSVCHNQHNANRGFAPVGKMRTSFPIGAAQPEGNPTGGGTATLTINSATAGAAVAKGYLVRVVTAGSTVAISHDNGLSWFRPTAAGGTTWVADAATPVGGPYTPGSAFTLDDPAVSVTITAGANAGDFWKFYVAYPFMRSVNVAGEMCVSCHQDRRQTHADVEGPSDGTRVFSHPVGVTLNANLRNYDRGVPLDVDGGAQGSGDANASNDLYIAPGNVVGCTSCHALHNADSNSITVDRR
jgi:predicted CXXCH cytochrome family protein